MPSVKDEIREAIERLNLSSDVFRELPDDVAEPIYRSALRRFVPQGEPRWWWEHFSSATAICLPANDGWRHIPEFVPDVNEHVWFIVEDDSLPFYPIYDATPSAIYKVIGECYGFEYYLVQREFQWLLCETHHHRIVGVGAAVEDRLRDYVA